MYDLPLDFKGNFKDSWNGSDIVFGPELIPILRAAQPLN